MKNNLKEIRSKTTISPSKIQKKLGVSLSDLYDIEANKEDNILIGNKKLMRQLCNMFNVEEWELFPNGSKKEEAISDLVYTENIDLNNVLFLDTSICMEPYNFEKSFLKYFHRICIPMVVMNELNKHKDSTNDMKSDKAFRALKNFRTYKQYIITDFDEALDGYSPDAKIDITVYNYAVNNPKLKVFFLSGDTYHNLKKKELSNLIVLTKNEFHNELENYINDYSISETEAFWKYLENNSIDSIKRMDLSKVNINGVHTNNYNPLCYAIVNRRTEIVNYLLSLDDIDINMTGSDPYGYGPIHCAIHANSIILIQKLISHDKFYPNVLSKDTLVKNVTPLMVAVRRKNFDLVKQLVDLGVSVNQQNSNGETALHIAAISNQTKIYDYLKNYVDVYIVDNNYYLAEEYLEDKAEV